MRFLSLCSGIDAASVAFNPLGWHAAAFSEIEAFPSSVLKHHYPDVPNLGDMARFAEWPLDLWLSIDAIVGGPPCQAFSVAGARKGLADARGNLTLIYVELINHADNIRGAFGLPPVIALYENVPGLLSSKDNAFGCLLAGLAGEDEPVEPPGKRWTNAGGVFGPARAVAWRTLDAQFFQLAQRRKRVFVVASARNGFDPAAVLFEFDGVRRDSPPRREAGEGAAEGAGHGATFRCGGVGDYSSSSSSSGALKATGSDLGPGCEVLTTMHCRDVAGAITSNYGKQLDNSDTALGSGAGHGARSGDTKDEYIAPTTTMQVRRLTPEECEALQGFPHIKTTLTLELRFDHQNDSVLAEIKCRKSHNNASPAEEGALRLNAKTAGQTLSTSRIKRGCHAVESAQTHYGQKVQVRLRTEKSTLFVSTVGVQNECHQPTLNEATAVEIAQLVRKVARTTTVGKVGSRVSIRSSFQASFGDRSAERCGHPNGADVQCAGTDQKTVKCTTSDLGLDTLTSDLNLQTWFCSVARAISGFIPKVMLTGVLSLEIEVVDPYTQVPHRGKPAADGPRYKALGNSWAVPCVAWIWQRVDAQLR
jgi:site-specific DNA-cytosine methylase